MQRLWFPLPAICGISSQSLSQEPSIQKTMSTRWLGSLPRRRSWLFPTQSSGANTKRTGRITARGSLTGRRFRSWTRPWRRSSTTSPSPTEATTRWPSLQTLKLTPQVFSSSPLLPKKTILSFFLGQDLPGIIHQSALFPDFCSGVLNLFLFAICRPSLGNVHHHQKPGCGQTEGGFR